MNTKVNYCPKVFSLICFLLFFVITAATYASGIAASTIHMKPSEIKWLDGPKSLPAGVKYALLAGDPSKPGLFTMRLKLPANYKIPAHHHLTSENVTVISGQVYFGMGDKLNKNKSKLYPAGSFVSIPPKVKHFAWTNNKGAVIQLNNMGPWVVIYSDPSKDPRKK